MSFSISNILLSSISLEDTLSKAEVKRRRKRLEKEPKGVKTLRDRVVALYISRTFGTLPL